MPVGLCTAEQALLQLAAAQGFPLPSLPSHNRSHLAHGGQHLARLSRLLHSLRAARCIGDLHAMEHAYQQNIMSHDANVELESAQQQAWQGSQRSSTGRRAAPTMSADTRAAPGLTSKGSTADRLTQWMEVTCSSTCSQQQQSRMLVHGACKSAMPGGRCCITGQFVAAHRGSPNRLPAHTCDCEQPSTGASGATSLPSTSTMDSRDRAEAYLTMPCKWCSEDRETGPDQQ